MSCAVLAVVVGVGDLRRRLSSDEVEDLDVGAEVAVVVRSRGCLGMRCWNCACWCRRTSSIR